MMKLKKGLSLVLALVLMAQLCLPVGAAVANPPAADPGAEKIICTHHTEHKPDCGYTAEGGVCTFDPNTCPDCNLQPEVPAETPVPEVPAETPVPEVPAETPVPKVPETPELSPLEAISQAENISSVIPDDLSEFRVIIYDKDCKPCKGHVIFGTSTKNVVRVEGGVHNITLRNVDIRASSYESAFTMCDCTTDTTVNLTLEGNNTLHGSEGYAGLEVGKGGTLTITEGSTGTLDAMGGLKGAGIGGSYYYDESRQTGTINIEGGTVTATGGNYGAGIGGAASDKHDTNGGTINITGGTVTATGGSGNGFDGAAGIGGGAGGAGGAITITGGVVTATGGNIAVPTLGGAGIGAGVNGNSPGSFSTSANGNATIIASSINDKSGRDSGTWRGMIFMGSGGKIYGDSFIPSGDVTIPSGNILYMKEGQTLTVPAGKTLTVNGYIYKNGGKVEGPGTITHSENILPVTPKDISVDYVNIGGTPGLPGTVPCTGPCKGHVITGTTDKHSITVSGGHHKVTLLNTTIHNSTGNSAFTLLGNANVDLTLVGNNMLLGTTNYAGLAVRQGTTLTITKESTGKLIAKGGYYGAGIGGDYAGGVTCQPGTININGGEVTAIGGNQAAGIGGGYCGASTINTGIIAIDGGKVTAKGGDYGAAIGGGYYGSGGTINILSGDVTANGGHCGAGIGGGAYAMGGNVYIQKGKVTANGGKFGAGIGSGSGEKDFINSYGANVTIDGGTVEAKGGESSAGIGGGYGCKSDNITINGGTVTAKGLGDNGSYGGAGIGGGYNGSGGKITITDGTVKATGGDKSAGIGGGYRAAGGDTTISGGKVNATAGPFGAGIGGGGSGASGTITISGGKVNATANLFGAGIGGGSKASGGTITITGGDVTATGGGGDNGHPGGGSGIGGGGMGSGGTIKITGGKVNATGAYYAAGVGGGSGSGGDAEAGSAGTIAIQGGTITATAGDYAAGIGDGYKGIGGSVTIDGDGVVFATKGACNADYKTDHIGNGASGSGANIYRTRGIIFEGSSGDFYGNGVSLKANATLPRGKNLTISGGETLTIPKNITLTNAATLFLDGGTISGDGKIDGNGTFKIAMVDSDIPTIPNQVYTGSPVEPFVIVTATHKILGKDFMPNSGDFSKRYEKNTNVGTATMVFTNGTSTIRKDFQIVPSSTTFESLATYKDSTETPNFTYGDIITVKAKPKATGTAALMAVPTPNQMALYLGSEQLCEPVNPDSSGVYTMTYNTVNKTLNVGRSTITAKYVGTATMTGASGDVSVVLWPKEVTATFSDPNDTTKLYDGTADFSDITLALSGMEEPDVGKLAAWASGTAASADVGTHDFTVSSSRRSGPSAFFYDVKPVTGQVTITSKPVRVTMTAAGKAYDGTTVANKVAYTVEGKVGADDVTATGTAAFAGKDASSSVKRQVNATGITLGGADAKNYHLPDNTASTSAAITPRQLTWNGAGKVDDKTYDGTQRANIRISPPVAGKIGGDRVSVVISFVNFANANVGTHIITTGQVSLWENDAGNYIAPTGNPPFDNGSITPNAITPTVKITGDYTFTGKQITPAVTVNGGGKLLEGSDYTVTYGDNINAGDKAGSVTVTLKGNYSGSKTQAFKIGKATRPSATTNPILMRAGETHSIPLPAISNAGKVTYSLSALTNATIFSQAPQIVGTNLTFTCAAGATTEATSTVGITITSDNYNDFTVTQTFKVTEKESVKIDGLTAQNSTYNGLSHNGYIGDIKVKDGNVSTGVLVYKYTGISGTTYGPTSTAPTDAGSYMLTIEVDANNTSYTGSHEVITFVVEKAPITVEQGGYTVSKVWNGNTTATGSGSVNLSVTEGVLSGPTVAAIPHNYPSPGVGSYDVIVDLALTDASGNYALKNNTITVTGTITKSATPPVAPSAPTAMTIRDTSIILQPLFVYGEAVEYGKSDTDAGPISWKDLPDFTGLDPATQYHFFARVKENANHPAGAASTATASTAKSAPLPVAPQTITITNGVVKRDTITLENVFGANVPDGAAFGDPVGTKNVVDSFTKTDGSTLSYTSKSNPDSTSGTDAYTVSITSATHQDMALAVSFTATDKTPATITATVASKLYDGVAVALPTPVITANGKVITPNYTSQWQQGGNVITNPPSQAGSYQLVFTITDDTYAGSLIISFTIAKRALTVTATSAAIKSRDVAPAYACTASGLAENETLDGVSVACNYRNDDTASSNAGRYPITVSGGTVSGGNDNYAITYVPGTLTVTLDTTALDAAIVAAKAAKSGVSTSDKDPGQVTKDTSFVSTAAMAALDATLAGAEASKAGATTNGQITAAVTALTRATRTFRDAIQTGTYSPVAGGDDDWEPAPRPKKPSADKFIDIKGHWAEKSIRFVVEESLFNGISDTLFAPDKNMTRGMLVTVLYRQAGTPATTTDGSAWYSSAQAWAMQAGISDGSNMEREMTRQELVTMLHRFAKQMGIDVSVGENTNILSYNDAFDLPQWSIPAFQWACGAGIVEGTGENLLPNATATRAEVATMLKRFAGLTATKA